MSPDTILENESRIREMIEAAYVDATGKAEPIFDGVIDPELYCSASHKIMWILKEPWDDVDSSGGGWDIHRDLLAKKPVSQLRDSAKNNSTNTSD